MLPLNLTRLVLDWFQDSSQTGSGINFFATFLAAVFATFLLPFLGLLMPFFRGVGVGRGVCV